MPAFQWIVLAVAAACGGHSAGAQAAPSRVVVAEAVANERYALRDRLDTYHRLAGARAPEAGIVVVVVEGDWHVRGDLLLDWASDRASLEPLRADLAAKVDPDVDEVFDVAAGLLPAIRRGEAIVDPAYAARARGVAGALPAKPVSGGAPR